MLTTTAQMGVLDEIKVFGLALVAAVIILGILGVYGAFGVTLPGMITFVIGLAIDHPRPLIAIVVLIGFLVIAERVQS